MGAGSEVCVGRGVCVGPIVDIAVLSTPSGTGVAVAIVATVGRGACIVEGVATIAVAPAGVYVLFPGEAWLQPSKLRPCKRTAIQKRGFMRPNTAEEASRLRFVIITAP